MAAPLPGPPGPSYRDSFSGLLTAACGLTSLLITTGLYVTAIQHAEVPKERAVTAPMLMLTG